MSLPTLHSAREFFGSLRTETKVRLSWRGLSHPWSARYYFWSQCGTCETYHNRQRILSAWTWACGDTFL